MDRQRIGTLIKTKRKEKKMKQKQLAAQLHVADATISKWENGINLPDIEHLKVLSSILDIPLLELLDSEDTGQHENILKDTFPAEHEETGQHDSASAETFSSTPEGTPSMARAPDTDADDNLPERKSTDVNRHFRKKLRGLLLAALLLCILPLGAMVIVNQVQPTADGACSFQIADEYYGDCDDEQAYYLIVEYMGEPSDESIEKHIDDIRGIYSGYFNECTKIFIYYVDAKIFYEETNIENSADYEAILYPLPSY